MPATLNTDVLIIGGGPAGIQAARLIRGQSPTTEVSILRPENHSMIYCALPYAIEGLVPLDKTLKSDDLLIEVGAKLLRRSASSLEPGTHRVILDNGDQIGYKRLLIATGARPLLPPIPGIELGNVLTIKTRSDTERIMERMRGTNVRAVIVGSGAIGIEQATAYRARGVEVHLVEMRNHILPHLLDADMSAPLEDELRSLGIKLHLGVSLDRIEGEREAERVLLSDGNSIDLVPNRDLVMMSVGMAPDVEFIDSADFAMAPDGIIVDAHMRTSAPDIWAAGDCTSFRSGIDGEALGGKLATNAVPMAKVAARDMIAQGACETGFSESADATQGKQAGYPGFFNGAATMVGSRRVAGTGFTETFAATRGLDVFSTRGQTSTRFPMMPDAGDVTVKLIVERGSLRIIGGQAVGSEAVAERIDLITLAIQHRMTAHDLAAFSYSSQPWQTFFPARNAIVDAAQAAIDKAATESLVESS